MSVVDVSLDNNDPEAYIELLHRIARLPGSQGSRLSYDTRFQNAAVLVTHLRTVSTPIFPPTFAIDPSISTRFTRIIDVLARAAITAPGQVATAVVSIKGTSTLETTIYISFNQGAIPQSDVASHIESLFSTLRGIIVSPETVDRSPPSVPFDTPGIKSTFSQLAQLMYKFGWKLWEYYLFKRMMYIPSAHAVVAQAKKDALSGAETALTVDQCETLSSLLKDISDIGEYMSVASKENVIRAMTAIGDKWRNAGFIDAELKNMVGEVIPRASILTELERLMAKRGKYFPLQRWINKIASFHVHGLILLRLVHSKRLKPFLSGSFTVVVVPSPPPHPGLGIRLNRETFTHIVTAVREEFSDKPIKSNVLLGNPLLDEMTNNFIVSVLPSNEEAAHAHPYVHSELAMLQYLVAHEIDFLSYFGVSKLPCTSCELYLDAFGEVTGRFIRTRSTHGKFYPAWLTPSLQLPGQDAAIRICMLRLLREELANSLVAHIDRKCEERKIQSDSSAGSNECGSSTDVGDIDAITIMEETLTNTRMVL